MLKRAFSIIGWLLFALVIISTIIPINSIMDRNVNIDKSWSILMALLLITIAATICPIMVRSKKFLIQIMCRTLIAISLTIISVYLSGILSEYTVFGKAALARSYAEGDGRPKDLSKAIPLYIFAADRGNAMAQINLGLRYRDGTGVPIDQHKATNLFRKASNQSNGIATAHLAHQYETGQGVRQDTELAIKLYELSLRQGLASKSYLYEDKREIDIVSKANLGRLYLNGQNYDNRYEKAKNYLEQAASENNASAMMNLGRMYLYGEGVKEDHAKAFTYFSRAMELGDKNAILRVAAMYFDGDGVGKDTARGLDLAQKAEQAGEPDAKRMIEFMKRSRP